MRSANIAMSFLAAALMIGCMSTPKQNQPVSEKAEGTMSKEQAGGLAIASPAFSEGARIPKKYTADGENVSPPLKWSSVPTGTRSFALIVDDPDAPAGTWVHWVIFNIPATVIELPEKVPSVNSLPDGAIQGRNDFHEIGFDGPSPPSGTHRYFFKLYALDSMLKLPAGSTKADLLEAMQGHVIAEAHLMGRYSR